MLTIVSEFYQKSLSNLKSIDILLLFSFVVLLVIRVVANNSSLKIISGSVSFNMFLLLIFFAFVAFICICIFAILDSKTIIFISTIAIFILIICLVVALNSRSINGSSRWMRLIFGFSFQPSELIKPFLIVFNAYLLSLRFEYKLWTIVVSSAILTLLISLLVLLEPDLGQSVQIILHWFFLLFLFGIPHIFVLFFLVGVLCLFLFSFYGYNHVFVRVSEYFLNDSGSTQVKNSLKAIAQGGLIGKGPGEGVSKSYVSEAPSDFIFSILSEEFGLVFSIILLSIFAFILVRTYYLLIQNRLYFEIIVSSGLVFMLILQMIINLSSVLNIIPTKGLTLPFISSGGSSLLSVSITAGMILSFTRKKYRSEVE